MQYVITNTRRYLGLALEGLGLCAFTTCLALLVLLLVAGFNTIIY